MKHIIGLLAMLLPIFSAAQSPPVKALNIGDTVPNITITNVYNYPASTIHLSDLKGKLVILDFWSTWCLACIESFPKMHLLQKEFEDQVSIILINTYKGDDIKRVKAFFEKRKAGTGMGVSLPYSLLQTSLAEYFPYRFIPHYIWIDKTGKIIAITSQIEMTAENIKAALKGNVNSLHTKKDKVDFDNQKPLFAGGNGGNGDQFLYRSLLTGYIEGIGNTSGIVRNKSRQVIRFYMFNTSALSLLKEAYSSRLNLPSNRIINETKNALFTEGIITDTLLYKNSFCYDLYIPPVASQELQAYIQEDIKRFFRVIVKKEKRNIKCFVLQKIENDNKVITKSERPGIDNKGNEKYLKNQPLETFLDILNNLPLARHMPVINETGVSYKMDIQLPGNLPDLDLTSLNSLLEKQGFKLSEQVRRLTVSVITEQ